MDKTKLNEVIGDFLEVGLLQKFLNDPRRLGMTEEEQKEKIKQFEKLGNAVKKRLSK